MSKEELKQKITEAYQLYREHREPEALAIVEGILSDIGTPITRIYGKSTPQEDLEFSLWVWLRAIEKGLTIEPLEPVGAHFDTLLRVFEPHEPDPEKLIEFLQKLADRGVEWAIEAVKKLKETGG